MAENVRDATDDVRQRRNARKRELYRRRRNRKYMQRRRTNIDCDERRHRNREYMQTRIANIASEQRQHTFQLNREPISSEDNLNSIPSFDDPNVIAKMKF